MKKQLQGISLILFAIFMTIGYGDKAFFDLDFGWSMVFKMIAIAGLVIVFLPDKKN